MFPPNVSYVDNDTQPVNPSLQPIRCSLVCVELVRCYQGGEVDASDWPLLGRLNQSDGTTL